MKFHVKGPRKSYFNLTSHHSKEFFAFVAFVMFMFVCLQVFVCFGLGLFSVLVGWLVWSFLFVFLLLLFCCGFLGGGGGGGGVSVWFCLFFVYIDIKMTLKYLLVEQG